MILLVSGASGYPRGAAVGHLVVPRQWNSAAKLELQPGRWAMDNGAFSGFDEGAFVRMLERFASVPGCLFACAPDVVADAAATLERWSFWSRLLRGLDLSPALVAQDGLSPSRIPWDELGALFIGGSTEFKEGSSARSLCAYAKARGIWVHWGRVNGKRRYRLAFEAGADSIDGTSFSIAPDTNIPLVDEWERHRQQTPMLPEVRA